MNSRAFSAQTNNGKTIISVSTRLYPIHLSAAGKPTAIQSDDLFCWDGQSKTLQLTRQQPASTNRVLFAVGSHSDDKLLLQDFSNSDIDLLLEEIAISARLKVRLCSISDQRSFFMIYHP